MMSRTLVSVPRPAPDELHHRYVKIKQPSTEKDLEGGLHFKADIHIPGTDTFIMYGYINPLHVCKISMNLG